MFPLRSVSQLCRLERNYSRDFVANFGKTVLGKVLFLNVQIHIILNDILTFLALNDLCSALIHQIKIAFVFWRVRITEGYRRSLNLQIIK